ncbi:MAG TPA: DNA primase [Micromonosporaceae bacterium]
MEAADVDDIDDEIEDDEAAVVDDVEGDIERSEQADLFWSRAKIEPIEIALPGGAGYTLRSYRMNTEIKPSDYTAREDQGFPDRSSAYAVDVDDEFEDDEFEDDELEELDDEEVDGDADDSDDDLEDDEDDEDEDDEEVEPDEVEEEVPLFLSQGGHLLVFRSRAGLVDFVQSDAEHDMTQIKGWTRFSNQVLPEYVVALPDETYELDLVVKNLRSGHDTWDPELLVQSGQIARDISHALHVEPVLLAMAPGSPLDDLDEALRTVAAGGVGTFFARRKMKKMGAETAAIGWRTVIGKISAVVDWRD